MNGFLYDFLALLTLMILSYNSLAQGMYIMFAEIHKLHPTVWLILSLIIMRDVSKLEVNAGGDFARYWCGFIRFIGELRCQYALISHRIRGF